MSKSFDEVAKIDVSSYIESKNGFLYLSWAIAWREFCKVYPTATYKIAKNEFRIPCFGDAKVGYMVYTEVTVEEVTHEMWLPIMDFKNKAMTNPDMMSINKAVMRCLTKNLAMFGLGISLYAGEDIPQETDVDRSITGTRFLQVWEHLTDEQQSKIENKYKKSFMDFSEIEQKEILNILKK